MFHEENEYNLKYTVHCSAVKKNKLLIHKMHKHFTNSICIVYIVKYRFLL